MVSQGLFALLLVFSRMFGKNSYLIHVVTHLYIKQLFALNLLYPYIINVFL